MVTPSDLSADTFTAGFQLMHRLRDPEFRAFLKLHGWEPGEHVVMAADDEPVIDVIARIMTHETGGHALVAIADDRRRHGFKLMTIEVAPARRRSWSRRRVEEINIAPDANIGMLYDAFGRCGEYVPSEWTAPLTVRKEPEPV